MDLIEYLVIFAMLCKMSSGTGLLCYKCDASITYLADEPLCHHFDYSEKYINECDTSTMCYKRITTTQFGTKIYERGCAKQTQQGYQELINGKWEWVTKINEVYEEGCVANPGDVDKVTKTEICHCRGNLCNGSQGVKTSIIFIVFMVGLLVLR